MPRISGRFGRNTPTYRRHKASGQAVVTLNGRDIYLGRHGSTSSKREYERVIGEWLAGGRQLASPTGKINDLTVTELAAAYLRYARSFFAAHPKSLDTIKAGLRELKRQHGPTLAMKFGPLALQSVQGRLAQRGLSRKYVNRLVYVIRRVFRWAVAQELLPPAVYDALATVEGLRKGHTEARERPPIKPVDDSTVDATLPHLSPIVADMVKLQRLTGARPAEICIMRPCDINRTGEVWEYRPGAHKTEHVDCERLIFIGPRAQAVLLPYLLREASAYCFSPAESEGKRNANRKAQRKSKTTPSQAKRRRKRNAIRAPRDRYATDSYRRAIHRACDKADELAHVADPRMPNDKRIVPRWSPNQIRHAAGTAIRRRHGLEAAQVVLGHARADVTQVYAERNYELARSVAREVG